MCALGELYSCLGDLYSFVCELCEFLIDKQRTIISMKPPIVKIANVINPIKWSATDCFFDAKNMKTNQSIIHLSSISDIHIQICL